MSGPKQNKLYLASISGAMYSGLPQQEQVISSSSTSGLESPKSVILILPSMSNRMFSSLMSRNRMLLACRQSRPFRICTITDLAWGSGMFFTFCRQEQRLPLGQYSRPKTMQRLVSKAYSRSIKLSCLMVKRMFFSFSSILAFLTVVMVSFRMNLRAQCWQSSLHLPRKTWENPPLPRNLLIQKSQNSRLSQLMGFLRMEGTMVISLMSESVRTLKVPVPFSLMSWVRWQLKGTVSKPAVPQQLFLLFSIKSKICFQKSAWMEARGCETGKYFETHFRSGKMRLILKRSSPKFSSSVDWNSSRILRQCPVWSPRIIFSFSALYDFSLGVEMQLSMADFSQGVPKVVLLKRQFLLCPFLLWSRVRCLGTSLVDRRGSATRTLEMSYSRSACLCSCVVNFLSIFADFDLVESIYRKVNNNDLKIYFRTQPFPYTSTAPKHLPINHLYSQSQIPQRQSRITDHYFPEPLRLII